MSDENTNHPSASFHAKNPQNTSGTPTTEGGSSSIGSMGASFTPAAELAQLAADARIRALAFRGAAKIVQSGDTIAGWSSSVGWPVAVPVYSGQTGTVIGTSVSNITVTNSTWGRVNSAGTLLVGAKGQVDNVTVKAPNALALATAGGVMNGATSLNGGTVLASSAGVIEAGDNKHNVSNATANQGGTISAFNGGTASGVVASGDWEGAVAGFGGHDVSGVIIAGPKGVVSNATALDYGTVIANGGTAFGVTASGNGEIDVSAGGTIFNATAGTNWGLLNYSAGSILVGSGGVVSGATISAGATASVFASGTIDGGLVGQNGTVLAQGQGAIVSDMDVQSGGRLSASGAGATVGGIAERGGTIGAMAGGTVSNATYMAGASVAGVGGGDIFNSITFMSGQVYSIAAGAAGSMSNVTASEGAGVAVLGSNNYISGATAIGNLQDPTGAGGASVDAFNGGTVVAGTAMSGGLVAAGGVAGFGGITPGGSGVSLLSNAQIMSDGAGIVGGNSNLTVTKQGTQVTLNGAGIAENTLVEAGGLFDVNSQGTATGGLISGIALVEGGGTLNGALFKGDPAGGQYGVNGYVDVGAIANSNSVESGALLSFGGGVGTGNIAQAGGTIGVGMGASWHIAVNGGAGSIETALPSGATYTYGTVSQTIVNSGGLLSVGYGGKALGATVNAQATMIVASGGTASGATIKGGQDAAGPNKSIIDPTATNGAVGDGGYVASGGILNSAVLGDGAAADGKISQMGGLLRVESGAVINDLHMGWYGQIEVLGVQYSAGESVVYNNGSITLMNGKNSVWGATLDDNRASSGYNANGFQVWDDNGIPVIVYDTCFLKGTRIWTPKGYVEVQNLQEGDSILAMVDGKEVERKITATRRQKSNIKRELSVDMAGWPVCIRAGALGKNLPENDLRVTPEHCFYFEGRFLPVRMLVNGFSIYYDTSLEHFDFFHFETEPHSIVRAEGVLTESWLNTEQRRKAVKLPNGVTRLETIPSHNWERDAAAPLDVSPLFAQNLWQKFHHRALCLSMDEQASQKLTFDDNPNLRLRLKDGREILPRNRRGGKYFFQLPAGIGKEEIFLVSKIFRPSESIGPWVDDRRKLGVLVGKITLAVGDEFREINDYWDVANAIGWDVVENSQCRWTKGEALLPVLGTEEQLRYGFSLIVDVLAGGPYPNEETTEESEERQG